MSIILYIHGYDEMQAQGPPADSGLQHVLLPVYISFAARPYNPRTQKGCVWLIVGEDNAIQSVADASVAMQDPKWMQSEKLTRGGLFAYVLLLPFASWR